MSLLLLALPAAVQAQYTYTTNNGAITITEYTGPGGAVTIPNTIDGLPVTSIGDWAFYSTTGPTSITIGTNVSSIGAYAFYHCTSLTSITIPDSVTNIRHGAFSGCTSLSAITVDPLNSAYSSMDGVFFNKGLTTLIQCPGGKAGSYTIPNGVLNIGDEAFWSCSSLIAVTIPNSVTSIGEWAFSYCGSLASVVIGNSATNIESFAFYSCTSLGAIDVDPQNQAYSSVDGVLFDKS